MEKPYTWNWEWYPSWLLNSLIYMTRNTYITPDQGTTWMQYLPVQISFDCMTGPVIPEFVLHWGISHFQYLTRIVYVHICHLNQLLIADFTQTHSSWSGIEAINTWQGWLLFVYYVLGWMEYLKSICLEYCICTSPLINKHYALTGRLLKAVMLDMEIGLDHGISN